MDFLKKKTFHIVALWLIAVFAINISLPAIASVSGISLCTMMHEMDSEESSHHSMNSMSMQMENMDEDCHKPEKAEPEHCQSTLECNCILEFETQSVPPATMLPSFDNLISEESFLELNFLTSSQPEVFPPPDQSSATAPPIFLIHSSFLI